MRPLTAGRELFNDPLTVVRARHSPTFSWRKIFFFEGISPTLDFFSCVSTCIQNEERMALSMQQSRDRGFEWSCEYLFGGQLMS